jgi:predicted deacylase
MRVGRIQAAPGEHIFGYLEVASSRSGLSPDIPVHLFVGTEPGPTLLVQGVVHGTEPVGSFAILNFVRRLDPSRMRGNVIAVPVVNRVGFELSERLSRIDNRDIGRLYPGNPAGSLSDQIAHTYFEQVIRQADVMIDFHQGGLASYERYVLFTAEKDPDNPTEMERNRRKLVVAFGLDSAAFFPAGTFEENQSEAIQDSGVLQFTLELGGATGWLERGADDVYVGERGIWNTLKAMGMIEGSLEADGPLCTIYNASVVLWKPSVDGLFIRKKWPGERVAAGEVYGLMVNPFTGETLTHICSTEDAIVIPGGREWPAVGTTTVGILGTIDEIVDRRTADLTL